MMMKKIIVLVFSIFIFSTGAAQPVANSLIPRVDKRVELVSIIFRLAIGKNFNDTLNQSYSKAIYNHFKKFSVHPLIKYVNNIADSFAKDGNDIGSWEIPSLAVHISQPPSLEPLIKLSDTSTMDGWDNRALLNKKMISLLQQFYTDADCATFFSSQEKYYKEVDHQYEKQAIRLNKKWVEDFFGLQTTENYYAILGLQGFGTGDYMRINFKHNRRNTYTLFGFNSFDKDGMPVNINNPWFARANLHEYIHAFTNQLIDKNISVLQEPAQIILANPKVWETVKETFYNNWQYILYESLVRACTIQYLKENREMNATEENEIAMQEKAGFFWMTGLVQQLDIYKNHRKQYRNLGEFMPEIINYFKKVADGMKNK